MEVDIVATHRSVLVSSKKELGKKLYIDSDTYIVYKSEQFP